MTTQSTELPIANQNGEDGEGVVRLSCGKSDRGQ